MKILPIEKCPRCSEYLISTSPFYPPYPRIHRECLKMHKKLPNSNDWDGKIPNWCPLEDMPEPTKDVLCESCKQHEGDGHPNGNIKCLVDGRIKAQVHHCDYQGRFA